MLLFSKCGHIILSSLLAKCENLFFMNISYKNQSNEAQLNWHVRCFLRNLYLIYLLLLCYEEWYSGNLKRILLWLHFWFHITCTLHTAEMDLFHNDQQFITFILNFPSSEELPSSIRPVNSRKPAKITSLKFYMLLCCQHIFLSCHPTILLPVSYTHLDVYKRQVVLNSRNRVTDTKWNR